MSRSRRAAAPVPAGLIAVLLSCSPCLSQVKQSAPVPEELAEGFNAITVETARERLKTLTSREFGGRGTGQDGFFKAAKWYAEQLEKLGWEPGGPEGSWFQNVPLVRIGVSDATKLIVDGQELTASFGQSSYVGEAKASGSLVFVNLADANADLGAPEQFNGKIVIYQAPSQRFRRVVMPKAIREAKPAGLIRVTSRLLTDRVFSEFGGRRVQPAAAGPPALAVTPADADRIAAACRLAKDFFTAKPKGNTVIATSAAAECKVSVIRESIDVPNVIGWYEGSDPELRHEHVGLGAHLDHLGMRGTDMYAGADDNGSGSTALLSIAEAVAKNPVKPKRSMLLIVFCGEELGLLGSRYYADHPTRPIKDMVCMLNMDMVGRNEEKGGESAADNEDTIHLVGSKRISMELHELTLKANKHIGFTFEYDEEGVYTRSDHANFARKGVPITFVFGGFHPDYHRTTDTIEKINFEKLTSAAKLNYLCAMMAAENGHFDKNEEN